MDFIKLLLPLYTALKVFFLKMFCSIVLSGYSELSWTERLHNFYRSAVLFGPIAFILAVVNDWFLTNQRFFIGVLILVLANMIFGGWMHWKKKTFKTKVLLDKTSEMIISLSLIYIGLEMIISHIDYVEVSQGFRMALQVTSLVYPFGKIAKNVFILTKGKYPPRWIMIKLYNFAQNGDLSEFLKSLKEEDIPAEYNPEAENPPI